jgi:hypothetical protein
LFLRRLLSPILTFLHTTQAIEAFHREGAMLELDPTTAAVPADTVMPMQGA